MVAGMTAVASQMASTGSGAHFDGTVCIPKWYVVPRPILRRAFQRLDAFHSPGCPGQLRASLVQDAVRRFDETFSVPRCDEVRSDLVAGLKQADEPSQVWWNDEELYTLFRVQLSVRERIFFLVDVQDSSTVVSLAITVGLVLTIFLSIAVWMVGTMPQFGHMACEHCPPEPQPWMQVVDHVCVYIFSLEYVARLLTVSAVRDELLRPQFLVDLIGGKEETATPIATGASKFKAFWLSPFAIIDLLTVVPYWLELATASLVDTQKLVWLRLFRMLRLSRVFKLLRLLNWDLGSLGEANYLLVQVSRRALPACGIFAGLIAAALVVFSGLIFTIERGDWYPTAALEANNLVLQEPGQFYRYHGRELEVSPFHSIPSSAWWTLVTITTVGYGDAVPVTAAGKTLAFVTILYGAILLGLPVGIIGAQFEIEFSRLAALTSRRDKAKRRRTMFVARFIQAASTMSLGTTSPRRRRGAGARWPASHSFCDTEPRRSSSSLGSARTLLHEASAARERTTTTGGSSEHVLVAIPPQDDSQGSRDGISMSRSTSLRRMMKSRTLAVKKACALRAARVQTEKCYGLPTNGADYARLIEAKHALEDTLRVHGNSAGISEQQRESWLQDLGGTQYCAGPALDRLGARILTRLADEERVRPASEAAMLRIRQAWHELCIVCCQVAEIAGPQPLLARAGTPPPLPRIGLRPFGDNGKGKGFSSEGSSRQTAPVARARSAPCNLTPPECARPMSPLHARSVSDRTPAAGRF